MSNNINKTKTRLVKGFSLVEMMVVVTIVIVITSILLFKQSKFSSDILVTNAAYEVALAIRQAQVYGISSKQASTGTNLNVGYGIYLSSPVSNSFIIYSDAGYGGNPVVYPFNFNTHIQNPTETEYTSVDSPRLTQGQTILRFCADGVCSSGTATQLNNLDIGFIKPNPSALIYANNSNIRSGNATIVVVSALGDKCRIVRITSIGQISVDTPRPEADECTNVTP
ncbi:MAG: hypothetical protein WCV55_00530 [Candidatus Paceibacterota bacterium]